jgi:ribonucleoside-diphosphate reductase subunit M2
MDILSDENERYVLFPIRFDDIWLKYKQHEACFWTASEIDLETDKKDWNDLTENEKHFIKYVLAFFSSADGIVNENLALRFYSDVKVPEARSFYSFQMAMESIHSETYSLLIDTLITDKKEQNFLFCATTNIPVIEAKANWCKKFIESSEDFATRLIAFACVEGIFFSGSFCAIYWLKKRGVMPGLTFSNELIARDEGLHTEFACMLYNKLSETQRLSSDKLKEIVDEAVNLEKKFITSALPCSLIGINCDLMTKYIEFVADRLLSCLGEGKLYKSENPFDWMELISMQGKTNFFEKRVGEYQKSGVLASINGDGLRFSLDDEF